ncbi:hypothetical protein B0H14DRAFT_2695694, partial [Mycena olivaceomarginata]
HSTRVLLLLRRSGENETFVSFWTTSSYGSPSCRDPSRSRSSLIPAPSIQQKHATYPGQNHKLPSSQTGNSAKRVFVVHSSPGNRCRSKPRIYLPDGRPKFLQSRIILHSAEQFEDVALRKRPAQPNEVECRYTGHMLNAEVIRACTSLNLILMY